MSTWSTPAIPITGRRPDVTSRGTVASRCVQHTPLRLAVVDQALYAVEDQAVLVEQFFTFRVSHETADRDLRAGQRIARRAARRRKPVRR